MVAGGSVEGLLERGGVGGAPPLTAYVAVAKPSNAAGVWLPSLMGRPVMFPLRSGISPDTPPPLGGSWLQGVGAWRFFARRWLSSMLWVSSLCEVHQC